MARTIIAIPARMQSMRLPGKPLADIHGKPMIVRVWEQAMTAEAGRVLVATDSDEIASVVRSAGGEAVMTRPDHASGSDRVFEAISKVDPDADAEIIVNLQGDLPTLEPDLVTACIAPLTRKGPHIATLACEISEEREKTSPDVVKVVATPLGSAVEGVLRTLYFTRNAAPYGEGPMYHHIGIYAYRRSALERFVALPPSPLEQRERLEQLRALEDGMRIDVAIVQTNPAGVDTPDDLERVRQALRAG
ncbi:MAG: 3-deoxy-manno-octulosonate cytidylyltransferase [Pseudomonadota bacterium]